MFQLKLRPKIINYTTLTITYLCLIWQIMREKRLMRYLLGIYFLWRNTSWGVRKLEPSADFSFKHLKIRNRKDLSKIRRIFSSSISSGVCLGNLLIASMWFCPILSWELDCVTLCLLPKISMRNIHQKSAVNSCWVASKLVRLRTDRNHLGSKEIILTWSSQMRLLTPILSSRLQSMMKRRVRRRITKMVRVVRMIVRYLRVGRKPLILDASGSRCAWMMILSVN